VGVGIIMAAIFWCFYLLALAIFAPIRLIWENIWRNPKSTATMTIGVVSAVLVSVYFDLPWNAAFSFFGIPISGFEVVNFISQTGPLVVAVIFFVVWFSLPVTLIILVRTTFSFSKANPSFFVGRMLAGFCAALYGYSATGFVPIKIAFYGIGALIVVFCVKTVAREM
jgi:hypothetical protein